MDNRELTNASSLQNLLKNTGGAIGTSLSTTMISRFSQIHQNMMVCHLSFSNNVYIEKLNSIAQSLSNTHDINSAYIMDQGQMYSELIKQSHLWGYIGTFRWFAVATFLLIPLLFFIKKPILQTKE